MFTSAMGPPLAFQVGGGVAPICIGYIAEWLNFSSGIFIAGFLMLLGPFLVYYVKLGEYDEQAGC